MNHQEREGIKIAATREFTQHDDFWTIPQSRNQFNYYRIIFTKNHTDCTCDEFRRLQPRWCRHLYGLREYLRHRKALEKPAPRPPAIPRPRNWKGYKQSRKGRHREFKIYLHALCRHLSTPSPVNGGRPKHPIPDLVYASVMKVRSRLSGVDMMSLLEEEQERGHLRQIPMASTILNFFNSKETYDLLQSLIGRSCEPLQFRETTFAIDSTYFPTPLWHRKYDEKQGKVIEKQQSFKAHMSVGIDLNIIAAVQATPDVGEGVGDASQFPQLLFDTAKRFRVLEVLADAAYCSRENFRFVEQLGAKFTTRFPERREGNKGESYDKARSLQLERPGEHFKRLGKRNKVESANSVIKRMFPGQLRFRSEEALKNEILCMALIYNIDCLVMARQTMDLDIEF